MKNNYIFKKKNYQFPEKKMSETHECMQYQVGAYNEGLEKARKKGHTQAFCNSSDVGLKPWFGCFV